MTVLHARISNLDEFARELRRAIVDAPRRGLVVAGFGASGRICGIAVNPRHDSLSWVKVWELRDLAAELNASSLLIALFPIGQARRPSAHELAVFGDLDVRARRAGIRLLDCLMWRGERLWSLRDLRGQCADD